MSKQSRKKARKHRNHRKPFLSVICQQCGQVGDGSTGGLLANLAAAMEACSQAGLDLRLRHGIVMAAGKKGGGYVLPLTGGHWSARTLTYDPFVPLPLMTDDDMDS